MATGGAAGGDKLAVPRHHAGYVETTTGREGGVSVAPETNFSRHDTIAVMLLF